MVSMRLVWREYLQAGVGTGVDAVGRRDGSAGGGGGGGIQEFEALTFPSDGACPRRRHTVPGLRRLPAPLPRCSCRCEWTHMSGTGVRKMRSQPPVTSWAGGGVREVEG